MRTVESTPAQRAHRIAVAAAMVRRALVDQECEGGQPSLLPDEMVCLLGLIESAAEELRSLVDPHLSPRST